MANPFDVLLEESKSKLNYLKSMQLVDRSGRYRLGPPSRPDIKHDNGFLDKFPTREPTSNDRLEFTKWLVKLEVAEALRPDLAGATAAYRHFLFGNGQRRQIDYERFIDGDPAGDRILSFILSDFVRNIEIIGKDRVEFSVVSDVYGIRNPDTENWQKTIGAHYLWVNADIKVTVFQGKIIFNADIVISFEDMYNFNPGQRDIATGLPDSANGVFEISGLAKQYINYGSINRRIDWFFGGFVLDDVSLCENDRNRRPSNNRRLRNKL